MADLNRAFLAWALCAGAACSSRELPQWTAPELGDEFAADAAPRAAIDAALGEPKDSRPDAAVSAVKETSQKSAGDADASDKLAVSIRFKAKVGDSDFACGERYADLGSTSAAAEPADLRFFVSDVRLIDEIGREQPVDLKRREPWQTERVVLIDFENKRGGCRQGTTGVNDVIEGSVPHGNYVGIVFRNGVPDELNHVDPTSQPPPLQETDLSWDWLTGFKFFLAELHTMADAHDQDGGPGATGGIGLIHVGSTGCTGDPQHGGAVCKKSNRNEVVLTPFDIKRSTIVVDVRALFSETDLSRDSQCHSADEVCVPLFSRLGLDFATGRSTSMQSVYRVE